MSAAAPSTAALLRLAGIVFIAVSFVVLGDTAGKLLTASGVEAAFVALSRFVIGALILLPVSGLRWHELSALRDGRVLLRGALIACAILCVLVALRSEPIANVFGAFFIGPIVSYVIATLFMGERSSLMRAALLVLGFLGVMLVVKPGFGASMGIGFALLAGVFYGCYLAMTKLIANEFRPRLLLMSQLIVGTIVLSPSALFVAVPELDRATLLLVLGSALGSAIGNYLLVIANRMGDASLIAPLVYSQLITATLVGVWVFGDWPDPYALLGLIVIFLSGVGSLWVVRQPRRS